MIGFYQITEALREELNTAGFKTVTLGEIESVDVSRQNIYPLAHIVPDSVTGDKTNVFSFNIVGADLVDFNKDDVDDENLSFYGTDNTQDVLHDIFHKLQLAVEQFRRGSKFTSAEQITSSVSYSYFIRRFENVLSGWTASISIEVPKSVPIC